MQYASGRITTQNLVPTGDATAGSAIALPLLGDDSEAAIHVTGTYTGDLTPQGTLDQVTWVDLVGVTDSATGVSAATIPSGATGIYRANVSGLAMFRLSANGAVTGAAVVHIKSQPGAASVGASTEASLVGAPTPTGAVYLSMLSDIISMEPIDAKRFISRAKHASISDMTNADDLYGDFSDMMGAFNAGGHLHFSRGKYNYFGSFFFQDLADGNLRISGDGMGRTVLNQTDTGARNALRIADGTSLADDFTSLTYYDISADVSRGATSVTLTTAAEAANFTAGEPAWIRVGQAITSANTGQPIAELVDIRSADAGTGVVTFAGPLTKDYAKDTSGTIFTYGLAPVTGTVGNPLRNIHIHDLTLRNAGENYNVWLRQMQNCVIERVQTFGRAGITSSAGSTDLTMRGCEINIDNELLDDFLYFFALDKGAKNALIKDNTFRSTGAGSLHIHEGVANVTVRDNRFLLAPTSSIAHTYDWPVVSIAGSSWNVHILDNLFINAPFGAIRASNSWKYAAPQHRRLKINGNQFYGEFGRDWNGAGVGDRCVSVESDVTSAEILGNRFDCIVPAAGSQLTALATTATLRVEGNEFSGVFSLSAGVGENNRRTGGAQVYTDSPISRSYGAASADGPRIQAETTGELSPMVFIGNAADAGFAGFYASSAGTLTFSNAATPGSTRGTARCRVINAGFDVLAGQNYLHSNTKVVGARETGWTVATGTATRTAFDTATVTLPELAERVKALIDDLHATAGHGLIGT